MTKTEMIKEVCSRVENVNQAKVDEILSAYADTVKETLTQDKDEKVPLPGIGNFSAKHVPEKSGVVQLGSNKGSTWHKEAHDELKFTISKSVKQL